MPGGHADGVPAGGAAARFQVFEAVTRLLAGHAAERGLLIVLDDLQGADPSTLRGLVHLARGNDAARLAIVATYRDTEQSGRDALREALGALAREPAVTWLRLVGLTEAQVSEYLAAMTGRWVPEDVVSIVNRRSKGNPFFVGEFAHLLEQGARDAVRGRLAALSPECLRVLATAALLGDEIRLESVAAVVGQAPVDVVASLDEARAAGFVDGSRFRHDIVREAARMELPTAARLSVHQRMAEHLEGRADVDDRVAEVADHWLAALPLGDVRRAVVWTRRAAEQAAARLAFEDAAALYARAVAAAARDAFTAPERCQLLIAHARAQVTAFDLVGAERSLTAAVAIARQSGDADAMADAALTLEGLTDRIWEPAAGPAGRRLHGDRCGVAQRRALRAGVGDGRAAR
jgi:predicted ATPase